MYIIKWWWKNRNNDNKTKGQIMKSNWHRRLYEWAWGAGEKCYVGKMRTKPYWKKHCRKTTRRKQKNE